MNIFTNTQYGLGYRAITKNGTEHLFFTAESFLVLISEGQEHILSHDEAVEWSGFAPYDPEFEYLINPRSETTWTQECETFEAKKKLELRKRFQELQRLPQFTLGFIAHNLDLDVVHLSDEDHDEIIRMYDQETECLGHQRSGFAAQQCVPFFKGQLIREMDQFSQFEFGHNKAGALAAVTVDERIPHVWVAVGASLKTEDQLRMFMRFAIKAILSCQVLHESRFGQDPYSAGVTEYSDEDSIECPF